MMKNRKIYYFIFILALISNRSTCSGSDTASTPDSLTIINNFSTPVLVEIWSGSNLSYYRGRIKGDNLKKELKVVAISNVAPNNTLDFSPSDTNLDLIIIFGTDQGTSGYIYLTELKITQFSGTKTASLEINGDIILQ